MSNVGIFGQPDPPMTDLIFYARGPRGTGSSTKNWEAFDIPRHARFMEGIAQSAGGGGGGGFTRAASAPGGGGGGGGGGARTSFRFPTRFLPERLWVQVPAGGVGSTGTGVAGGVGGRLFIIHRGPGVGAVGPIDLLIASGNGDAGGGGAATGAAVGAAGAAGSAASATIALGSYWATALSFFPGLIGSVGGAVAGGAGANQGIQQVGGGGTGGGGTTSADFAGGSLNASGVYPSAAGGAAGSPGTGGSGWRGPDAFFAGTGGGSSNAGVGGAGADGNIGAGGGGGGAGTTGGAGGNGGDGRLWLWFS